MNVGLDIAALRIKLTTGGGQDLQTTVTLSYQQARLVAEQLNASADILEKLSADDIKKLSGDCK